MTQYEVAVKELATNKVIHTVGPCNSEREAREKVQLGMLINMNHEKFIAYVREVKSRKP